MTDIIIKSFNRTFYLDRCLQSIYRFVKGDFNGIVLDDGTPNKYLNKIRENYSEIEVRLSEPHDFKIQSIKENIETRKEIDGFQIPIRLWYDSIQNASGYVFVNEDDVWLTEEIDLNRRVDGLLMKYDKDISDKMTKILTDRELPKRLKQGAEESKDKYETTENYRKLEELLINWIEK